MILLVSLKSMTSALISAIDNLFLLPSQYGCWFIDFINLK